MTIGECLTSGGHIFSNHTQETKTRCARCGHRPGDVNCDCPECKEPFEE